MPLRIFVSYSWKSKADGASVPELLTFLEDGLGADVWVDNEQMVPGVKLKKHLAHEIRNRDVVVLILSHHVVGNANVAYEIEVATKLNKPILACRVDDVKQTRNPHIDGLLRIDWSGPGATRALAERKLRDFLFSEKRDLLSSGDQQIATNLRKLSGALENMNYRRTAGADRADDRAFAARALAAAIGVDADDESVQLMRDMKEIMQDANDAGDDVEKLESLCERLEDMEAEDPDGMGLAAAKLREELEGRLAAIHSAEIDSRESPVSRLRGGEPRPDLRARRKMGHGAVSTGQRDPGSQVRALLSQHIPAHLVDQVTNSVLDYVGAAPAVLNAFASQLVATGNQPLLQVAAALEQYLREPNDLLPDHLGVVGLLDDAWLIHNTVAACIARGITSEWDYPIDWNAITQANGVVERLLPPRVHQALVSTGSRFLMHAQAMNQAWTGFATGGYGVGPGYQQSTEELRDELGTSVGGLMLAYGV